MSDGRAADRENTTTELAEEHHSAIKDQFAVFRRADHARMTQRAACLRRRLDGPHVVVGWWRLAMSWNKNGKTRQASGERNRESRMDSNRKSIHRFVQLCVQPTLHASDPAAGLRVFGPDQLARSILECTASYLRTRS